MKMRVAAWIGVTAWMAVWGASAQQGAADKAPAFEVAFIHPN